MQDSASGFSSADVSNETPLCQTNSELRVDETVGENNEIRPRDTRYRDVSSLISILEMPGALGSTEDTSSESVDISTMMGAPTLRKSRDF